MSFASFKQPAAAVPIFMSLAALTTLLVHIALYGVAREADEGAAAHIWQLLMAGQLPVIAFYALRALPHAPKPAMAVLGVQFAAILAAVAPVYLLGL